RLRPLNAAPPYPNHAQVRSAVEDPYAYPKGSSPSRPCSAGQSCSISSPPVQVRHAHEYRTLRHDSSAAEPGGAKDHCVQCAGIPLRALDIINVSELVLRENAHAQARRRLKAVLLAEEASLAVPLRIGGHASQHL